MTRFTCLILLAAGLAGCGSGGNEKRYPMQGEVKQVDPTAKTATIAAGKVGDWMDAMTMEYPVKPEAELGKMHAGDHIEATVVVQGERYYVTGVKVVAKP